MTLCCTKTDIDDLEAYMICIFISLSQFLSSHAISLRPVNVLLARDSICLARYMLSPFAHPSVRYEGFVKSATVVVSLNVNISKTVADRPTAKVTIND